LQSGSSALIKDNTFSAIDESGVFLNLTSGNTVDGNSFVCKLFGIKGYSASEIQFQIIQSLRISLKVAFGFWVAAVSTMLFRATIFQV